jgi:hypothetical protein
MADRQPDRFGEQPAPEPDTIVEVFERNSPWEPVADGQWYIVRDPETGAESVLYRRPSGEFVGAVVDLATLRARRGWRTAGKPAYPPAEPAAG